MLVHVATIVGGLGVDILPHTIRYYQSLGLRSFRVIVHQRQPDESFVTHVTRLARSCGVAVESTVVDENFPACQQRNFKRLMETNPDAWFLPIDCDEFQRYPFGIATALAYCERRGYDYLRGCLVDRISEDGTLSRLKPDLSIWNQYPLGGALTHPLFGGDPRKIAAAKGRVLLSSGGHHGALSGVECPPGEMFIPVHHFKWVDTLVSYLKSRRDLFADSPCQGESDRCIEYFTKHARVDLTDGRLMVARCDPEYPFWNRIREIVSETESAKLKPQCETNVLSGDVSAT